MKTLDIALKDLQRSLTNAFFLVFGLVLPLLTGALFYFAFGGLEGDGGFELPTTPVVVANLDEGGDAFRAGDLVVEILKDALPGVLEVREVADAVEARSIVDRQEAAVAVIVPAGFSAAALGPGGQAAVEVYRDPTLTLGPAIVESAVAVVVDSFSGSKIAAEVAAAQLAAGGANPGAGVAQQVAMQYAAWASELGELQQTGNSPLVEVVQPDSLSSTPETTGAGEGAADEASAAIALTTAGMMVFYVFFTGGAGAQNILQEEEAGTLPRLFTTPTSQASILGGKFLSTFLLLAVQITVIVLLGALIFGIEWGDPLLVILVIVALVVIAASFGIFVTSFMRDTRQGGIVFGGAYTVLGMVGMMPVFVSSAGGENPLQTASMAVPQGWGVRAWQILLAGGGLSDVALLIAVMLAAGALFFIIGVLRFRKRYA
jgi:ABC-2 type transport system permease protein